MFKYCFAFNYINITLGVFLINKFTVDLLKLIIARSSRPEVYLRKGVLKICSKFTGEHPCRGVISIKLLCTKAPTVQCGINPFSSCLARDIMTDVEIIEIALRHGCSPVILLHIFRTPFFKNTYGRLLLLFTYFEGQVHQMEYDIVV